MKENNLWKVKTFLSNFKWKKINNLLFFFEIKFSLNKKYMKWLSISQLQSVTWAASSFALMLIFKNLFRNCAFVDKSKRVDVYERRQLRSSKNQQQKNDIQKNNCNLILRFNWKLISDCHQRQRHHHHRRCRCRQSRTIVLQRLVACDAIFSATLQRTRRANATREWNLKAQNWCL